ncbi:MAG: acetylornithine aminotransferase [Epulopiscium sp. Nuni2H_MBin001]|nr:MAG: acetylornithine aminotransferase [Epulopiscium sp. Nuni2H_MBin001]
MLMNTYAKPKLTFVKGDKCVVYTEDGDAYTDFTSGIGVSCLGYNNEGIGEAMASQVSLMHLSNLYNTKQDKILAQTLCEKTGLTNVFFGNSGAEANEGAIKIARKYSYDKYGEGRFEIITLTNSFHGRTITTLKATGQDAFHKYFLPFPDGFVYAAANDIADVKSKISDKTCAIMIEFVQGEGGVLPLDKQFVSEIKQLCEAQDILLIADEVQTGVGRTGKFCAFMHYNVVPDVITLAKGLGGGIPIGAVISGEKCKDTFGLSDHGSTFGGNPLCCCVANSVMAQLTPQRLADVSANGEYFLAQLNSIDSKYIKAVRGIGLMIGVELVDIKNADVKDKCLEKGMLILTAGNNTLRFLPPLIITKADIDKLIEVLKQILDN